MGKNNARHWSSTEKNEWAQATRSQGIILEGINRDGGSRLHLMGEVMVFFQNGVSSGRFAPEAPGVGLRFLYEGRESVALSKGDSELCPGDFLIWETTEALVFRQPEPVVAISLVIPQSLARIFLPNEEGVLAKKLHLEPGLGTLLASQLSAYEQALPGIAEADNAIVLHKFLELLSFWLRRSGADTPRNRGDVLVERIKQLIVENLLNPDFSIDHITSHFQVSKRQVQYLFERRGETLQKWALTQKLEACRDDLRYSELSITEIALKWNFSDSAHFSRSFKKRYNICPKQYRRMFRP